MFAEVPLVLEGLVADKTRHPLAGRVHVDHVHAQVTTATEPAVTQHADLRQRDCNQTYTRTAIEQPLQPTIKTLRTILDESLEWKGYSRDFQHGHSLKSNNQF